MRLKEKQKRTTEEEVTVELKCDLCGRKACAINDWSEGAFTVAGTTVMLEEGTSYGDSGDVDETTIDICPECFKSKLIPWVEQQGGKPTVEHREW